jgi:quinol monooxygenase YgiN
MGRVTLQGFLICRSLEEADRVSEMLPEHIRASRAEPGCIVFEVLRSSADPVRFAVHEVFSDKAAFEAHQARIMGSDWWRATQHIPRDYRVTGG